MIYILGCPPPAGKFDQENSEDYFYQMTRIQKLLSFSLIFSWMNVLAQIPLPFQSGGVTATKDELSRYYLAPQRIVWASDTSGTWVQNPEVLLQPGDGQTRFGLKRTDVCHLHTQPGDTASLILDFGIEIHGSIQITTATSNRVTPRVRVRLGESVGETMSTVIGDGTTGLAGGATNHHAMRDFEVLLPGYGTLEVGNSGFRFVRIDLLDTATRGLALEEVRAVAVLRDIPYKGSFECSDSLLNKIWLTGAYTVHLNMQEYLWDGIKRDRMVWVGDMHPQVMTISTVFGPHDIVPLTLDYSRDSAPLPRWMNGISAYSIYWILMQYDWYMYHGDRDFLLRQQTYLKGLLELLLTKVSKKGLEELDGGMRFLDWPSSGDKACIHAGLQALMVMAFERGAWLCRELQEEDLARTCLLTAEKMKRHQPDAGYCKQGAALMGLAGLIPAKASGELISRGGAEAFSTFYGYYMLEAQAQAGNYQVALDQIRTYWGAMLKLGATTFWEDFDMAWMENSVGIDQIVPESKNDVHGDFGDYCYIGFRRSLCHGWSSGPTPWMTSYVLGLRPTAPGGKSWKVDPHLGDLQWAQGAIPTPFGLLKVSHIKNADGSVSTEIDAPEGVVIAQ